MGGEGYGRGVIGEFFSCAIFCGILFVDGRRCAFRRNGASPARKAIRTLGNVGIQGLATAQAVLWTVGAPIRLHDNARSTRMDDEARPQDMPELGLRAPLRW